MNVSNKKSIFGEIRFLLNPFYTIGYKGDLLESYLFRCGWTPYSVKEIKFRESRTYDAISYNVINELVKILKDTDIEILGIKTDKVPYVVITNKTKIENYEAVDEYFLIAPYIMSSDGW